MRRSKKKPKKPSARKPSARKPSARKPSARKPSDRKPSDRKPSARKPSARKPKKPSARKPYNPAVPRMNVQPRPVSDIIFGPASNVPTIVSLSGPISFYYFRPTRQAYENNMGKYLPLLVLFGDAHRSMENVCQRCTCANKNSCCYSLSNPEFLASLDSLSDPRHPVDFYTETFLIGTKAGFKGGVMEQMTTGNMIPCYHRTLRGNKKNTCPTKQIRWHAGDPRQAGFRLDNAGQRGNDTIVRNLRKIGTINIGKKYIRNAYIEFQLSMIFKLFEFLFEASNERLYNQIRRDIYLLLENSVFQTIGNLQHFLKTLCGEGEQFNYEQFAIAFFRFCTPQNSLIYKQLIKQDGPFRDIPSWIDFYAHSINREIIYLSTLGIDINYNYERTVDMLSDLLASSFSGKPSSSYMLPFLSSVVTVPLLDLYTLARIWKQPTNGIRSSLSFCYFGNDHITNIASILERTNLYERVHSNEFNNDLYNPNRCQTFAFTLNLSEEVRRHNQRI
jgi:hypothetical protein